MVSAMKEAGAKRRMQSEKQNEKRGAGLVKVSKVGESAPRLDLNNPSLATCGVK
jgi:hypothetical protein